MNAKIEGLKPVAFLLEVKSELSKVVWPTREQSIKLTAIVVGVSIAVGAFIGGLDYILTWIAQTFLYK